MNVLELAQQKGLEPRRVAGTHGGEYASPCPGCGGRDRFRIWPAQRDGNGAWWCRGCDKGGDGIQFLIEFNGKTFVEAARALGRELPKKDDAESFTPREKESPSWRPRESQPPEGVDVDLWREKAAAFVDWAHRHLLENEDQLTLLAGRGISLETVKRFKLGYNPGVNGHSAVFRPREAWGLPVQKKADGRKKKLWIPRGIVIPHLKEDVVLRIRIRRDTVDLTPQFSTRYYIVPGSTMAPMLIHAHQTAFVVVETELDACLISQAASDVAGVLALGSAAAKPDRQSADILQKADCILNALDFDRAGSTAAWSWWKRHFKQARRWPVPEGKDPGEAFAGGVDIRIWVLAGLPPVFGLGHEGPSSLTGVDKGAPAFDCDAQGSEGKEPPAPPCQHLTTDPAVDPIEELRGLLQAHPVTIESTEKRLRIIEAPGRRNWEKSRRISQLVFFNEDVFDYLVQHPDRMISGRNL